VKKVTVLCEIEGRLRYKEIIRQNQQITFYSIVIKLYTLLLSRNIEFLFATLVSLCILANVSGLPQLGVCVFT